MDPIGYGCVSKLGSTYIHEFPTKRKHFDGLFGGNTFWNTMMFKELAAILQIKVPHAIVWNVLQFSSISRYSYTTVHASLKICKNHSIRSQMSFTWSFYQWFTRQLRLPTFPPGENMYPAAWSVRKMRRVASVASRAVWPERTKSTQGRKADNSWAYLSNLFFQRFRAKLCFFVVQVVSVASNKSGVSQSGEIKLQLGFPAEINNFQICSGDLVGGGIYLGNLL